MITETADGIPGDPLNVGLVGDEAEVHRIMLSGLGSRRSHHLAHIAIAGSVAPEPPL